MHGQLIVADTHALRVVRALLSFAVALSLLLLASLSFWSVGPARGDELIYACGLQDAGGQDNSFLPLSNTSAIESSNDCGRIGDDFLLANDSVNKVAPGGSTGWFAESPPGLAIAGATVPTMALQGTVGTGYEADFFWTGSTQRVDDAWTSYHVGGLFSNVFGWELKCAASGTPCPADGASFAVYDIQLDVRETVNPTIVALGGNNLWYRGTREYVRGAWPSAFSATAPSGIASMGASENDEPVQLPVPPGCPAPNRTVWQQCPGTQTWSPTVALSGNGPQPLVLSATSAAGNTSPYSETIDVDSQAPAVSLSGPSTASSTSGTQYVTASATTGPSGLGAIDCSVDGGASQSYTVSPASVPVSGLGMHTVTCTASNRSYDANGQVATSAPASWSLDVQEPSVTAASFSTMKGLKCGKVIVRHKVKVRRHGRVIRVKTIKKRVIKCHPKVVMRKICRKRHCRRQRVAEIPHVVQVSEKRVGYGKRATVSGWLGTASGVALAGEPVAVMTAPYNGDDHFTQAATALTTANGTWSATLPAGESRLVVAQYGGSSTVAPATSAELLLVVRASIGLVGITPRRVAWGGTIHIHGRLSGGWLPPAGELVRLRIGYGNAATTYGVRTHVTGSGRFSTSYTFGAGVASVYRRYWFGLATLPVGDYPYAPARSRWLSVLVGGHPHYAKHHRRAHHKRHHAARHHPGHHKPAKRHRSTRHKKARRQ
jgi:hypothetical protein